MNKNIKKTVFEIFSDVMDIPISELKLESTDNIVSWDSLSHVKIIMQIEHQFKINLLLKKLQKYYLLKMLLISFLLKP